MPTLSLLHYAAPRGAVIIIVSFIMRTTTATPTLDGSPFRNGFCSRFNFDFPFSKKPWHHHGPTSVMCFWG
uniref:Putative secreted protein n=1 Tax=Anopheles triannulatus TaxID=58253 RepID=A0A2M4B5K3_9DIPT